jgi:acetyl-CoA acyltransferase
MTLEQMELIELNEAFAAQAIYCIRELGINEEIANVNGGAVALGHPLGCTGAKLTTQLIYEMQDRKLRWGLVSMCIGFGMGAAAIFEIEDY